MKILLILALILYLPSCISSGDAAKALIDQLEFGEGEHGCVRLHASIDLNPLPLIVSNATLDYRKSTGPDAPEC